jgi:hypothetical protein
MRCVCDDIWTAFQKKKTEEQGENGNEVRFLSEKFVLNDGVLVCYACRRERM